MTKLVPFEESPEAMDILNNGKALTVHFVFDPDGPYKGYEDYYYELLGFTIPTDRNFPGLFIATIICEIGNMPQHYAVVGQNGKTITGLHGDLFHVDVEELEDLKDII